MHVTLTLDTVCHAPAMQGTVIQIISTSTAVGSRVLATRCEVSGWLYRESDIDKVSHEIFFTQWVVRGTETECTDFGMTCQAEIPLNGRLDRCRIYSDCPDSFQIE
jgi:hypothetical protein